MEIRQSYKKRERRASYDSVDPEAGREAETLFSIGTGSGRRGSLASASIPIPKSPAHTDLPNTRFFANKEADTLPQLQKGGLDSKQHRPEPASIKYLLPPGASAARRGSLPTVLNDSPSHSDFQRSENHSRDDNFLPNIQQARKVKCFYLSQPGSPAPLSNLTSPQAATTKVVREFASGFGAVAGEFLEPKRRRSSASSDTGNDEPVPSQSILSIIAKSIAGAGSLPRDHMAKQVFQVLINPIPKAPSSNSISSDKEEDLCDRPEYVSLPLAKEELHKRLRRHGEWIRKGEMGFITGKNKL